MPTPEECKAQYEAALGPNPTPLRQVQCTFQYTQCLLSHAQAHAEAHIQSLVPGPAKPARAKSVSKAAPKRKPRS